MRQQYKQTLTPNLYFNAILASTNLEHFVTELFELRELNDTFREQTVLSCELTTILCK